jgi:subtilisin family serine protease
MATITINGNSIDPISQKPQFQSLGLNSVDTSASDYILFQTAGPLTKEQKAALSDSGVTILEYVPVDSYIAYYPPKNLTPITQLPFITWAGVYPKQVKIEPVLRSPVAADSPARVVNVLVEPQHHGDLLDHQPKAVEVVLHGNVDRDQVRNQIAQAAGLDPSAIQMEGQKARLIVSGSRLNALAQVDGVRHIEEYSGDKLYNNVALQLMNVTAVHTAVPGLEGEGEVIAVCDTGLDTGDPAHIHPAFTGRVQKLYPLARTTASDPHGHGTHVSGSALGDAVLPDGTPLRGTAPKASLVLQSVLNANGGLTLPPNLNDLFAAPYTNDGCRVHSNSWGDTIGDATYSQQSREVDEFVWAHRDCVICFAAGNSAADTGHTGTIAPGSVGAPSTAKNCISVGASESLRPENLQTYNMLNPNKFPVNPIASDKIADNPQGIAAFSGRGLTRDQRIKPDLVSPGCTILSTKSSLINPSNVWGISPDPNLYMFDSGTSMATPLVAGCAAVVRESFRMRLGVHPSAALVKAMLITGAVPLRGQYIPPELPSAPNGSEGFGIVNLSASVAPAPGDSSFFFQDEAVQLDVGDRYTHTFTVPQETSTLKVTLVWSDPPGEALQNDLDLSVQAVRDNVSSERHGNMPLQVTDFDRTNNVEQVTWENISPGDVLITVSAFRITVNPQSFALVVRAI